MTALAIEPTAQTRAAQTRAAQKQAAQKQAAQNQAAQMRPEPPRPGCVITADATYAARLAHDGGTPAAWYPERWTLDGPEPYAVPLPAHQPEEPGTAVLPLTDGRVLVQRRAGGRHLFSLLYPTGPATGEVPLGAVECEELTLLPPVPAGQRAYAIAAREETTDVWLVAGGAFGPEHVAEVKGRCSGGVWLEATGRLLALDRAEPGGGPVKTVAVDLERGGEVSPLLQITEGSEDRLLLADPDSGLILLRSDAVEAGRPRLGWGVLGSTLPIRFPRALRPAGCTVTPFAAQPGQTLTPEGCAVALRIDGAAGTQGSPWLGVWRPAEGVLHQFPAPRGWLAGSGFWSRSGELALPYATDDMPCGLARLPAPKPAAPGAQAPTEPPAPAAPRPVPLAQAPLGGRRAGG
ncbi:hypothetical protein [Streptomyces sp. NPDC016845]|uniref:hypothetical protein n=1 Tax=Streptomyces sp. NPDC016845 TaxID=3364972 RepID=UPI00379E74CA